MGNDLKCSSSHTKGLSRRGDGTDRLLAFDMLRRFEYFSFFTLKERKYEMKITVFIVALTLQTLALADLSAIPPVEVQGPKCSFTTRIHSAEQIVELTVLGPSGSGVAGRFEIPANLLPLREQTQVDLSDALTEAGLSYRNGYLKIWKRDKTNFFESDSLGIYIDPRLQKPGRALLWEGLNYVPFSRTQCRF